MPRDQRAPSAIDYQHLALIEDQTPWTFDRLCEMAERGETMPRIADDTWMNSAEAGRSLGLTERYAAQLINASSVRAVSVHPTKIDARCGVSALYHREDMAKLTDLCERAALRPKSALRVFDVLRADGLI